MSERICSVEGCGGPREAKGLCSKHYNHSYYLAHRGPQKPPRLCSLEGCGRLHFGKGLCQRHYNRRAGPPQTRNREKANGYARTYYLAHREQIMARSKAYYLAHREHCRERNRQWQNDNPERMKEMRKASALRHIDTTRRVHRLAQQRRNARKAKIIDNLTKEQMQEIISRGCFFSNLGNCEGPLSIAHDIPIGKNGNTTFANLFCLCRRHNGMMRTKTLAEMVDQLGLFEEAAK